MEIGLYHHYKGGYYLLLGVAAHSETEEPMAVYVSLDATRPGLRMRVRPLHGPAGFCSYVDDGKVSRPRFMHVADKILTADPVATPKPEGGLEAAEPQLAALRQQVESLAQAAQQVIDERKAGWIPLESSLRALAAALKPYIQHKKDCDLITLCPCESPKCTCGQGSYGIWKIDECYRRVPESVYNCASCGVSNSPCIHWRQILHGRA